MRCIHTLFPDAAAVNPGGSGMLVDFDFAVGGELRSRTHCGGGGSAISISDLRNIRYTVRCKWKKLSLSGVEGWGMQVEAQDSSV